MNGEQVTSDKGMWRGCPRPRDGAQPGAAVPQGHVTSRRELLAEAGRWALFAGLAAGVLWLARKGARKMGTDTILDGQNGVCPPFSGACGRCPALAGCRLPQAVSAKRVQEEG